MGGTGVCDQGGCARSGSAQPADAGGAARSAAGEGGSGGRPATAGGGSGDVVRGEAHPVAADAGRHGRGEPRGERPHGFGAASWPVGACTVGEAAGAAGAFRVTIRWYWAAESM